MKFRGPNIVRYAMIGTIYPMMYMLWIGYMEDTWVFIVIFV